MIKKQRGFSLIELMVVVAIAGIVTLVAVPTITNALPKYNLKRGAQDLSSYVRKARSTAIKMNSNVSIEFDAGNNLYTISDGVSFSQTINLGNYGSGVRFGFGNATAPASPDAALPANGDQNFTSNRVTFNSRGVIDNAAGSSVYIQNAKGDSYATGITIAGNIMLRKWRGGSWQ